MPMSLRVNPQKKELFEQDKQRPIKRIKTEHIVPVTPAQTPPYHPDSFPIIQSSPTPASHDGSINSTHVGNAKQAGLYNVVSEGMPVPGKPLSKTPAIYQDMGLDKLPTDPKPQVDWLVATIRSMSQDPHRNGIGLSAQHLKGKISLPLGDAQATPVTRVLTNRYWKSGRRKGFKRGPRSGSGDGFTITLTPLENTIDDVLFREASDSERFYGKLILDCLRRRRGTYDFDDARALAERLQSSHSRLAFLAALETLAKSVVVQNALQPSPGESVEAPSISEVPSLVSDSDIADLSTSTESEKSLNSHQVDASSLQNQASRDQHQAQLISGGEWAIQPLSKVHSANSKVNAVTIPALNDATTNNMPYRSLPKINKAQLRLTSNLTANVIRNACATLVEMAEGQFSVTTSSAHESGAKQISAESILPQQRQAEDHVSAMDLTDIQGSDNGREASGPQTTAGPTRQARSGNDQSSTLANGEDSQARKSGHDLGQEPNVRPLRDRRQQIKENPNIDKEIYALIEGIILELVSYTDHDHGIASLPLHIAQFQYVHREKFIISLRYLLDKAPPTVSCLIDDEQTEVSKILYRLIQNRVSQPRIWYQTNQALTRSPVYGSPKTLLSNISPLRKIAPKSRRSNKKQALPIDKEGDLDAPDILG
ncbi:uncharacterized protein KY384_001896 [Bacidia gigantensis]|uniref:uncharacterized protein n=1 Tax=Bacidia gigantensis TaxID=2732470 RepID=UPI001D037DC4|nr:uncharacterized protein KY384_001896 [Bacidia gigantensis]KAG8533113.1 hypothetical protein KY384_001896 [Bacidia gigantensis]